MVSAIGDALFKGLFKGEKERRNDERISSGMMNLIRVVILS